jgi:hypothetical protein
MEAIRSSETSDKTGTTRCYTPEEDILHSHRRENLKSYITFLPYSPIPNYLIPFPTVLADVAVNL